MTITAEMIKELRERTGVGMGQCKKALETTNGDLEAAIDHLRKAGMASAVKKEGRETKEGAIGVAENKDAVSLVEVNSETDFVAENEKFRAFLKELCEEVLRSNPSSLDDFLAQKSHQDPSITIDQYRSLTIQSLGENIQVRRFVRLSKNSSNSFGIYSHMGGKIVCLVELSAKGEEELAKEIAMHVAAEAPEYLFPEEIPADVKAREEEIARAQIKGKPENMIEKIVAGKMKAFYDQVCLVHQKYIKDNAVSVGELVEAKAKATGHPIAIRRFIRWQMGQ